MGDGYRYGRRDRDVVWPYGGGDQDDTGDIVAEVRGQAWVSVWAGHHGPSASGWACLGPDEAAARQVGTSGVAGGSFGSPSSNDVRWRGGGGGEGAVMSIVGVRPALPMLSCPLATVAFLVEIWGRQGVVDGVLSALG